MKKFFKHLIFAGVLVVAISILLNLLLYRKLDNTPAWGNPLMQEKYNDLLRSDYNTLALGSSKIFRQFNAGLFDSLCSNEGIKSFNMGVEGTFPPETYYLLEDILRSDTHLRYILLEVRAFDGDEYQNWHTIRSTYWYNFSRFHDFVSFINEQNFPFWRKVFAFIGSMMALADQNLNLGKEQFLLNQKRLGYTSPDSSLRTKGFQPFYTSASSLGKDTSEYNEMRLTSEKAFQKQYKPISDNNFHYQFLMKLKRIAEAKNIKLIFFMPDNQKYWMYDQLIPLFDRIDAKDKIIVSNANVYPMLYWTKYKANVTHLNENGSRIFTTEIAKYFRDLIKNTQ